MAALRALLCVDISASSNKRKKLTTWLQSASRGIDELPKKTNSSTARLLVSLDIWLNDCISGQRMIRCVLTDISTCHSLTIEIRWDPGGLTDISSFCQTAYNFNTGHVIQSITLVIKLRHLCQSLHANTFSFFEVGCAGVTQPVLWLGYNRPDYPWSVRFLTGSRDVSHMHNTLTCPWAHTFTFLVGTRFILPVGKAAGSWSWPPRSI